MKQATNPTAATAWRTCASPTAWSPPGSAVLLFDEAEDLFGGWVLDGLPVRGSRVLTHRLLERTAVPVIWTANDIRQISSAALRRMTLCLELRVPTLANRIRLWRSMAGDAGPSSPAPRATRRHCCNCYARNGGTASAPARPSASVAPATHEPAAPARPLLTHRQPRFLPYPAPRKDLPMTCEVAVMNTRGIALAADSAVTLGDGEKIYDSAEKLFQLAPNAPVGIMTYGEADLMQVPWETIVAGYRQHLGERRFGTLHEYLDDFVAFIEGAAAMFPEPLQRARFGRVAHGMWRGLYAKPWRAELAKHRRRNGHDKFDALRRLIAEDHPEWDDYPLLHRSDPAFADAVIGDYADILAEAEQAAFEEADLPEDIRAGLRTTLKLFLTRACFLGPHNSGVVIAGMGEREPFPALLSCRVGPIAKGRLKLYIFDETCITHDDTAMIIPFAQRETIDMIIEGIHPGLKRSLLKLVGIASGAKRRRANDDDAPSARKKLEDSLQEEIADYHSGPFVNAVSALPRHDLAAMAESLVNLTAFRAHASTGERETVAGPIDVAVLSKGDGFVWVKQKRFGMG